MDKIKEDLYIGDVDDVKDSEYLDKKDIDVIINLSSWSPGRETYNDYTWINIPIKDGFGKQESFDAAVRNTIHYINTDKTLLVNCAAGVSRSATVLSTAIACIEGIKLHKALETIKKERPIVNPNSGVLNHGKRFMEKSNFSKASKEQ